MRKKLRSVEHGEAGHVPVLTCFPPPLTAQEEHDICCGALVMMDARGTR